MKKNNNFYLILFLFFIISITTIYSTLKYVNDSSIFIKQIIFYIIGFLIIRTLSKIPKIFLTKYSIYIYIILNVLLLLVLFIGKEVNGARAWFNILGLSIQPSEFMKIGLILFNAKTIDEHNKRYTSNFKNDLLLITKIIIITIIPSILTFLEPDTGAVIIYFIISLTMLFISNIKSYWFFILFTTIFIILGGLLYLYFL